MILLKSISKISTFSLLYPTNCLIEQFRQNKTIFTLVFYSTTHIHVATWWYKICHYRIIVNRWEWIHNFWFRFVIIYPNSKIKSIILFSIDYKHLHWVQIVCQCITWSAAYRPIIFCLITICSEFYTIKSRYGVTVGLLTYQQGWR